MESAAPVPGSSLTLNRCVLQAWNMPCVRARLATVFHCARSSVACDWGQTRSQCSMAPDSFVAGDWAVSAAGGGGGLTGTVSTPASLRCCAVIGAGAAVSGS
jgi:hypothetical protein